MEEHLRNQIVTLGQLIEQCTIIARQFYKDASDENLEMMSMEELARIYGDLVVTQKKVMEFMDVMDLKNL